MICVVLCYWQRAAAQQLARVGQTTGVGTTGMVLGVGACDVPNRLLGGRCEGWPEARAVVSCVAKAVTHLLCVRTIFPHTIATHLH
jgi:hypothetical protein